VIEAILYGFSEWLDGPVPLHTKAFLFPPDILLSSLS
jgi:hypothetical protein